MKDPDRVFNAVLDVAKAAGMVGRKRVLDSTALYDAVATQDTVTMIRSAIRAVLRVAVESLARKLREELKRDDDYETAGKPACDWDDKAAREALVDALARDAHHRHPLLERRTQRHVLLQHEARPLAALRFAQSFDVGIGNPDHVVTGRRQPER